MAYSPKPPLTEPAPDGPMTGGADLHAWVLQYGPALRRYFQLHPHAVDVDDLVQEVFLAMQARGGVDGIEHVGRYIFRVAANVMAGRNRPGTWRWSEHATLDELILADECSPERALIAKETLEDLLAA